MEFFTTMFILELRFARSTRGGKQNIVWNNESHYWHESLKPHSPAAFHLSFNVYHAGDSNRNLVLYCNVLVALPLTEKDLQCQVGLLDTKARFADCSILI